MINRSDVRWEHQLGWIFIFGMFKQFRSQRALVGKHKLISVGDKMIYIINYTPLIHAVG